MQEKPAIVFVGCEGRTVQILRRYAHAEGWKTDMADSVLDAERKCVQLRPKVILLDAHLGEVEAAVKKFKAMPTIQKSHIVICAREGDTEQIQALQKLGVSGYLIKGHFSPTDFIQHIEALLAS